MAGLTDTKIKGLKPTGKVYRVSDGDGLYLEVRPKGDKFWRYRFVLHGKPTMMSLGQYLVDKEGKPAGVTLKMARELRDDEKARVKTGVNPVTHREAAKLNTFEAVALAFCEEKLAQKHWTPSTYKRSVAALKTRVMPVLGSRPIADIKSGDILPILEAGNAAGKSIRRELQILIGQVFRYGVFMHLVATDPTAVFRKGFVSAPTKHSKALNSGEIRAFFEGLATVPSHPAVIRAVELLWLTTARRSELTQARWCEIDLDEEHGGRDAVWIIPADRMKKRAEHRVPLIPRAIELLKEIKTMTHESEWVLPSQSNSSKPIGRGALYYIFKLLAEEGQDLSPHCVRASFSSWAREAEGWSDLAIEKQLAHQDKNSVRAAYDQSHQLPERRRMLMVWHRHIEAVVGGTGFTKKVVSIR